ncbi:MAG TPA: 50S ribosomal protein L25 [Candidatus Pacebacteria bacterium]|nr:50S ribosomal protein L25 [Candidatus Paceibacterota bacterium]
MATMIKLKAQKREDSSKDFSQVLGVVYGHNKENISVTMDYNEFEKVYNEAGMSSVITIDVEGDEHDVVIKDFQIDPRKDRFHHVDFYEFTKGQKMEATVSLKFIGEAPAEKLGMVLNIAITEVSIISLPKDLPSEIEVDLSVLVDGNSVIRLGDLNISDAVELVDEPEETVISVVAAREVGEDDDNEAPDLSEDEGGEEKGDDKKEEDKKA